MELLIRGHDIAVTDEIREYVARRTQKLDHLIDRVVDAQLELRTRHNRTGGDITTAQLTLQTRRNILRAEERDQNPLRAIDQAVDKMIRQIRRYHDKRTDRKGPRLELVPPPGTDRTDELGEDLDDGNDAESGVDQARLVRTKRFAVKPMDTDEAIEKMELLGHDFYLFLSADEEQMNVVYRRDDGTYGLLAPNRR
ncbi:MAG: Ribosome hibernation promoting factor Hpf [uncultured Thermomicrobiales bacterium]|uniref:Ribosome hibernation promoting factor n=1 Tax=uncultured Thermomicrobiales bacterium TaxID=1645740 RepID=A0A6J4UMC3_9BACT|nr:MAG: Ribosome hibernation promoting factor Hpf [uncultured Thermomicrobiales bacterium]